MNKNNSGFRKSPQVYIVLHILFFMYSLCGISSKLAGRSEPFSLQFFFFYGIVLLNMFIYAILWQQVLGMVSLVTAYANKAVTVLWGLIWGILIFGESITINKLVGVVIIVVGIVVVVRSDDH